MAHNINQYDFDEYPVADLGGLEDRIERLESMVKHLKDFEWFVYDVLPAMDKETQAIYKEVVEE